MGTMKPELPTTGSRMTPAISPLCCLKISRTPSRSLYVAVSVAAAQSHDTDDPAWSSMHHRTAPYSIPQALGYGHTTTVRLCPQGSTIDPCIRPHSVEGSLVSGGELAVSMRSTCGRFGHARRVRQPQGGDAGARLDQEAVCVAVVAPHELQQLRSSRERIRLSAAHASSRRHALVCVASAVEARPSEASLRRESGADGRPTCDQTAKSEGCANLRCRAMQRAMGDTQTVADGRAENVPSHGRCRRA